MRIKIVNVISTVFIASTLYLGNHYFDISLRDNAYKNQVEPSFYEKDLIKEYNERKSMQIINGNYQYEYTHTHGEFIRTFWSFNNGNASVKAFIISNTHSKTPKREPNYIANAKYTMTGSVVNFTSIEGDIGLLPKLGLPIDRVTPERLWIALASGDVTYMAKVKD